ncbi:Ferulate monolignol transferase [Heracleum sosnowskyi]|uniref:Ferulate monolignol transferase n=1 Tax=Heracleum sosnowskyi TaxID=360622 RepID=A0AAD8IFM0_9APIA|nr:Ferulate monolignol transferase [Heracleum sosnowskyi]
MAIQVMSKSIVKPAVATPDHLKICKLSFFDQLAPPAHVPLVSFYHNTTISQHEIRKHLVTSLSLALAKFYPFAGRFVQDGFYVDCNDEGVLYVEAEVDLELDAFLGIARKNVELVNDLVPWTSIGETSLVTTPIMGIKVTMFKCGGLSIAILLSHVIADGYTAATFVHEWAVTTSHQLATINHADVFATKSNNYEFGVATYFPSRDLSAEIKPAQVPSSKIKDGKIVTKRFVFDENAILTLKAKVSKSTNISRPTRVEVVTSTIWKALVNMAVNQSKRKQSTLYLHLNLRGRTSTMAPPLPSDNTSLCGNFYMEVPTKINNNQTDARDLHDIVNLLRKSLRNALGECSKISSPDKMFSEVAKNFNEIEEGKGSEEEDVHLLSTLCRFPVYEVDFGWGKPEWVTTGGIPAELIFLFDTKCETGIEAIVNLNEADMIEFENDVDINAYTS